MLAVLGISALLGLISVIVPISRRLMLPYTLVLAVVGTVIGLLSYLNLSFTGLGGDIVGGLNEMGLLDDTFIYVYLPPLLFAAGLNVDLRHIMEDIWYVLLLAIVAVIACTLAVGYALHLSSGIGLVPSLLFGTIVSTTDTAAVVNIFREVGAPKRLGAIVEGEALFNDAAAIAMFGLFIDMTVNGGAFDLFHACRDFLLALLGGAAFGYVLARACGWLIALLKDTVTTEVTLTIALAYITFVIGNEVLGISGVVATVVSAIVISSVGRTRVSPGSWEILKSVWEHLDFWATCLIFVTSAMFVPRALSSFSWADGINVLTVFCAALVARAVILWGTMPPFSAVGASKPLSHGFKFVLWWGGMRGAVTIALALAAAATTGVSPQVSHLIVSTAIGYVMATLIINGLTLRVLMNFLALDKLGHHDQAIRSRVFALAKRRIAKELEVAALHIGGHNADELVRMMMPGLRRNVRFGELDGARKQYVAVDTWCQHEHEAILLARERGIVSRRNADVMRHQADQLQNMLHILDIEGYRKEAERLSQPPMVLRVAFVIYRTLGWSRPLSTAIADRIALLLAQTVLLKELMLQADQSAVQLFGGDAAQTLKRTMQHRVDLVEGELRSLQNVFPLFTAEMRKRHVSLMVLGLLEAEFRRHLSEATISAEVFDDLDAERRMIAAQYNRRPKLDLSPDTVKLAVKSSLREREIRGGLRRKHSLFAYPGEELDLARYARRTFYVFAGSAHASRGGAKIRFEEGTWIVDEEDGQDGNDNQSARTIRADGYLHLLMFRRPIDASGRGQRESRQHKNEIVQPAARSSNS